MRAEIDQPLEELLAFAKQTVRFLNDYGMRTVYNKDGKRIWDYGDISSVVESLSDAILRVEEVLDMEGNKHV